MMMVLNNIISYYFKTCTQQHYHVGTLISFLHMKKPRQRELGYFTLLTLTLGSRALFSARQKHFFNRVTQKWWLLMLASLGPIPGVGPAVSAFAWRDLVAGWSRRAWAG